MRVCTLASGSSGNATYISSGDTSLLVDAGLSGKGIIERLGLVGVDCSELDGILVTHEHIDHIKGVGVLARKFDLQVYATEKTWLAMEPIVGNISDFNKSVLEPGKGLEVGGLKVEHFDTSHDAVDSIGFSFFSEGISVGVATDTGYLTNSARKNIDGADLLVFEANHDLQALRNGRYPWALKQRILGDKGHLSNIAAGHCLASLVSSKTQGVILAHLSSENNSPDLAYSTVASILMEAGLLPETDIKLEVAPRSMPGDMWDIV